MRTEKNRAGLPKVDQESIFSNPFFLLRYPRGGSDDREGQ